MELIRATPQGQLFWCGSVHPRFALVLRPGMTKTILSFILLRPGRSWKPLVVSVPFWIFWVSRVVTVAFQESRLSLDLQADTTALPECTIWCPSNRVYTAFDTTSRTSGWSACVRLGTPFGSRRCRTVHESTLVLQGLHGEELNQGSKPVLARFKIWRLHSRYEENSKHYMHAYCLAHRSCPCTAHWLEASENSNITYGSDTDA